MNPWYLDQMYWLSTLTGECCSTTQLMGRFDMESEKWEYALVMYHDGKKTLKCNWIDNRILYPV